MMEQSLKNLAVVSKENKDVKDYPYGNGGSVRYIF